MSNFRRIEEEEAAFEPGSQRICRPVIYQQTTSMILSDDDNYGVKELTNLVQFVFDAAVLELESGDVVHRV